MGKGPWGRAKSRHMYKEPMDKDNSGGWQWKECERGGVGSAEQRNRGKWGTTVIEQ